MFDQFATIWLPRFEKPPVLIALWEETGALYFALWFDAGGAETFETWDL